MYIFSNPLSGTKMWTLLNRYKVICEFLIILVWLTLNTHNTQKSLKQLVLYFPQLHMMIALLLLPSDDTNSTTNNWLAPANLIIVSQQHNVAFVSVVRLSPGTNLFPPTATCLVCSFLLHASKLICTDCSYKQVSVLLHSAMIMPSDN